MISAWIWGFIFSRFLIWSRRMEGIRWMPVPDASSWYCLTDLKFKIHRKRLTYVCVLNALASLMTLLFIPQDELVIVLVMASHVASTLWWPAFFELKWSWLSCFLLSLWLFVSTFICIEILFRTSPESISIFFLPMLIGIYGWMLCISSYAYFVAKVPVTSLEYNRRTSRSLEV